MPRYLILSMRPYQWTKNLIVFSALLFSRHFLDPGCTLKVASVFLILCLLSGSIYLINDVVDLKKDREHPVKKNRPVASGKLPPSTALTAAVLVSLLSLAWAFFVDVKAGYLASLFLALNIAYSLYLKNLVILDVLTIAASFLLRTFMGGVVISVELSHWLIICCTFLALFLGFGKRRHELCVTEQCGGSFRDVNEHYNKPLLDQIISVVTTSTLIFYCLYTMAPDVMKILDVKHLNLTLPFVLYGLLRYLYLVYKVEQGGSPSTVLLSDRGIQAAIVLWIAAVAAILWFHL